MSLLSELEARSNLNRQEETITWVARRSSGRSEIFVERKKIRIPKLRQERHLPPMANTYSQIYIHVIFAVEGRQKKIFHEEYRELLRRFEVDFDERFIFKAMED